METVWTIFFTIWVCCLFGWLVTRVVPAWRKCSMWLYVGILVSNIGVFISCLCM